jgi:hypothetical protein
VAYWLYCQSCKEWSKSTTPMSSDKICPYCSIAFYAKTSINPALDQETAQKSKELQNEFKVQEIAAIPTTPVRTEEAEIEPTSTPPEALEAGENKTEEISSPAQETASDTADSNEIGEEVETDEGEDMDEASDTADEQENLEVTEGLETLEEVAEKSDESEAPEENEKQDVQEAPKKPKMTRTHETYLEKKRRSKNNN